MIITPHVFLNIQPQKMKTQDSICGGPTGLDRRVERNNKKVERSLRMKWSIQMRRSGGKGYRAGERVKTAGVGMASGGWCQECDTSLYLGHTLVTYTKTQVESSVHYTIVWYFVLYSVVYSIV